MMPNCQAMGLERCCDEDLLDRRFGLDTKFRECNYQKLGHRKILLFGVFGVVDKETKNFQVLLVPVEKSKPLDVCVHRQPFS